MGPNAVSANPSTTIHPASDAPAVEAPRNPASNFDPASVAELLQALAARDDAPQRTATRGVDRPSEDEPVDNEGLVQALGNAEAELATDIQAFMALFTQLAQQMRKAAREQRQNELQAQVGAIENAADQIEEAAAKRFVGAVLQGATQIGSGVLGLMQAGHTAARLYRANPADLQTGSKFLTELGMVQGRYNAGSQLLSGSGTIISGGLELAASVDDADAKRAEADGTAAQARREAAQEVAQNMADLLRDIREQLRAIAQSTLESNRGMARNI